MKKGKKREAFNFYRSYYDTLNDIYDDADKLKYLMAILDRQFKGIETELVGIPKLAYTSQKHSIDKQVEGWENKTGEKLHDPTEGSWVGPTEGGSQGGLVGGWGHPTQGSIKGMSNGSATTTEPPTEGGSGGPTLQEQEKGKEKEKEQENRTTSEIFDNDRFYNHNLIEIHHIMDTLNVSKEQAILLHKEFLDSMSSIFN